MVISSGGCFWGAGQLPEGLLLPCMNVTAQEWYLPAWIYSFSDCCLYLFVGGGGGSSLCPLSVPPICPQEGGN
eukprot:14721295-Ditylum_brightwellii.AAC.1